MFRLARAGACYNLYSIYYGAFLQMKLGLGVVHYFHRTAPFSFQLFKGSNDKTVMSSWSYYHSFYHLQYGKCSDDPTEYSKQNVGYEFMSE